MTVLGRIFDTEGKDFNARWHFVTFGMEHPSHQKGCALAGEAIRKAITSIENYLPSVERDINDSDVCDWGDVDRQLDISRYEHYLPDTISGERKLLCIGGDHSISIQTITTLQYKASPFQVLYLDAHSDAREEYLDINTGFTTKFSHASVAKRLLDLGCVVGGRMKFVPYEIPNLYRSYSKEEVSIRKQMLNTDIDPSLPFYISLDLDWLEPIHMQAVGNPEPGGTSWGELIELLRQIVVLPTCLGLDLVEYNPLLDPSGVFGVYIAQFIRLLLETSAFVSERKIHG